MQFGQKDDFKTFNSFLFSDLRAVTGNKTVWDAFVQTAVCAGPPGCWASMSVAWSYTALLLDSDPYIRVFYDERYPATMTEDGITFDRQLVECFEKDPSSQNKRGLELLCLHELLHWVIWRAANDKGNNEPVIIGFEQKAYGKDREPRHDAIDSMYWKKRTGGKGPTRF